MMNIIFFCTGILVIMIMSALWSLSSVSEIEMTSESPLESGLSSMGEMISTFSLQLLTLLVLFMILDLEIIFVISLVFSNMSLLTGGVFLLLIVGSLWMEYLWGKLLWSV